MSTVNKPICVYDSTPSALNKANPWFQAGASLYYHSFRAVHAEDSPDEFYAVLEKYKGQQIDLRVWGHGAPGQPAMGHHALFAEHPSWEHVKRVHFRMCYVAAGAEGIKFVNTLAERGIEVIAHVGLIGFMGAHSYTYGVRAHKRATWPASYRPKHSFPFGPRTVMATDLNVYDWMFSPHKK